jgi:cytochrome c
MRLKSFLVRGLAGAALAAALAACSPPAETTAPPPAPAPAEAPAPAAAPTAEAPPAVPADVAAAIAALPAPYNEGDYDKGRVAFAQCRSCHTLKAGAPNGVGPNLHAMFGRGAGQAAGFNYSTAVKESGITWDGAQLDQWLANPRTFLPGNRMSFAGVKSETTRRDLIAYLKVETAAK